MYGWESIAMSDDLPEFENLPVISLDDAIEILVRGESISDCTIPDLRQLADLFQQRLRAMGKELCRLPLALTHCQILQANMRSACLEVPLHIGPDPRFIKTNSAHASSRGCVFRFLADFSEVTFHADSFITCTRFVGSRWVGAEFGHHMDFTGSKFNGNAIWNGPRFVADATFKSCVFQNWADFRWCSFSGKVDFDDARFCGLAAFDAVSFCKDAKFPRTKFKMPATFIGVRFQGNAEFWDAQFSRQAFFERAAFTAPTSLDSAFFNPPACLLLGTLGRYPSFRRDDDAEAVFRVAKNHAETRGDYLLAGDYYYEERVHRSRRRKMYEPLRWLENIFVRGLFGYGERPARILIAAAIVMTLAAFGYLFLGVEGAAFSEHRQIDYDLIWGSNQTCPSVQDIGYAFYFSAITFATVGYGDVHPLSGPSRGVAALEGLSGIILTALFVVCVAKRFTRG